MNRLNFKNIILKGRILFFFSALLLFANALQAQYIQFVENKGQWDNRVNYSGQVGPNAFFLEKNGYRVSLSVNDDWIAMADFFSGHKEDSTSFPVIKGNGIESPKKPAPLPTDGTIPNFTVRCHAYEATFLNASPNPEIVPEKAIETYNNYYLGSDKSKWVEHCRIFQAVVYKNMYPNIDVRYYTYNNQLKYDIIVRPGGDPSQVALRFDGANSLSIKKGNLVIATSVGNINELSPLSYQTTTTSKTPVDASFSLSGNTVRFKTGTYDPAATLVIDPQIIFSSLSGSSADNWGFTATYDNQGNFYSGGIVFASGSFPTTVGAYSRSFGGGSNTEGTGPIDVGILKLTKNGRSIVFGTYLGGTHDEQPHSLVVDADGNLLIAGRTSSKNFPQTIDKFGPDNGNASDKDIFLTKLSGEGTLLASRRFGGTGEDGVNIAPKYVSDGARSIRRNYGDDARSEVLTDASRNVYVAGCTQSRDFKTTANAFQTIIGNGNATGVTPQDAVIIKTSPDLKTVYLSSYLGGKGDDDAFVLALNPADNNIYLAGGTTSPDLPQSSGSSFKGGVCDGFVSIVDNSSYQLLKTTYYGTPGEDLIYGIQFDKFAYPYIMGTTTGSWPVNAAWSQTGGKQFISKLRQDMNGFVYSTVFGKGLPNPDISPTAFLVDRCENVYVSGWSGQQNQTYQPGQNSSGLYLQASPKPYQSRTDGSDFYFFVLQRDASAPLYATFYGQNGGYPDHVDGGTSRFDRDGIIYQAVCANCGFYRNGVYFPVTTNVVGPRNNSKSGGGCNLGMIKIAFQLAGIGNGVRASIDGRLYDTTGCVPLTVDFIDTLNQGKKFVWNFGDGTPDTTTLTSKLSHTYTQIGDYVVRLISVDSSACNIADTAYTTIRARKDKAQLAFTSTKQPPCTNLSYLFANTSVYPAGKPFTNRSFVWDYGDGSPLDTIVNPPIHKYDVEGTYIIKLYLIDTNYCNAPDVLVDTLRIAANVKAQFETPAKGCEPYTAVFNNTSLAGQTFFWDFGDGTTSTDEYPTHLYQQVGRYQVTLTANDPNTCNQTNTSPVFIINVYPNPTAEFTFTPVQPVNNTPTTFYNGSTGASSYLWNFGDGEEIFTTRFDTTIRHTYNHTDSFPVRLISYNQYGCTDTVYHTVSSLITPLVNVPNALSPTGVNRFITVKGFGIVKMDWRIYNRWGTMVYDGTSQKIGWDGTYKGVLQPMEVYTYTLSVEFYDGTKYQKTGDITLIR